uniref:Spy0128 family protein n=1 Tax=Collinsella sp. TaxID=1965294 RepID=UPI003FEF9391
MSYGRRRGLCPVSPYAIVLVLAVALTASFFLPLRAEAAISGHTVPTISPSGTTINLFDYWVNPDDHLSVSGSGGVNAGHKFQFNDGKGDGPLNQWTGGTSPRPGIVNNTLSDGYPKLSEALGDESLDYLFDSSAQTGKTSHFGVTGLLKVQGGYYVYDSSENYAAYNADKNAFDIYDTWGIGNSSHQGQFFPFDAADEVFNEENGRLVQNGITADNTGNSSYNGGKPVNHHFGLSMSTRFVQPNGGLTNDDKPMTFEFAGDDDVWVFIDDVLVGDIGGIHDRASLSIDFQTGDIKVNGNNDGTLLSKYQAANKDTTSGFAGNTFKDSTNHTLKFFYLERGALYSNMELKFNLVTVPESDIIKFDQDGKFVQGAEFKLYKTDKDFKTEGKLLGSGTTDEAGHLTLTNDVDNGVINFDDLYEDSGSKYYLLKETRVPEGYRSSLTATDGSMQLEYVPKSDKDAAGGVIINRGGMDADSAVWQTGAFAGAKETITAPSTVYKANDDQTISDKTVGLDSGILFAVVLKRDKSASTDIKDQNNWYAVSGDPSTGAGYTLAKESGMDGAIKAAKKDLHAFTLNTSGQYQVEIPYLPGDISSYYYMLSGDARKDAEYAVAIYHTTASSIANANTDNTVHVFSDDLPSGEKNFQRQFATRLLVTNIQNRLFVQKTDTEGKPVDGAKFGLYKADQVKMDANGKVMLNGEQTPFDTLTTGLVGNPVPLEGAGIFPNTSDGNRPLVKGTYFLKEVSAPKGFLLNDTLTKVIVDDYGVHADAGTADDGVSTFVGPGALMKSLGQFGAEGDIDNTLTWIKGQRQTSDGTLDGNDNLSWNNDAKGGEDEVHLKYGANGRVYQYGPTEEGKPYRLETETGWIRMGITQDVPGDTNAKGARANLDDMNLNALFTGATCVRVANEREASLEVTKKVALPDGLTGNKDAEFTFKFTVPEGKTYKAAVFKNAGAGKQAGDVFDLKNGDTHAIKADETIRVYGLGEGDEYAVQELTGADKMPAGYKLTGRKQGTTNLTGAGESITGEIEKQKPDGTLAEANKLVFTNTYKAEASDELTPQVTKKVSGVESTEKAFSFTLTATEETQKQIDDDDLKVSDALAGNEHAESKATSGKIIKDKGQTVDFSGMKFNKAGTYTFTLTEAHDADDDAAADGVQNSGWTMDASTYTVTVRVEDKNAKLTVTGVTVEKSGDDKRETLEVKNGKVNLATFNNSYAAKGSVTLAAKKQFTGGTLENQQFSFQVKEGDKVVAEEKNDANGDITFPAIDYTEAGEHDYAIKEVEGTDPTIVYDGKTVKVRVSVTDNKNGTLSATATYDGKADAPTFTNSKPTADATIEATKTLKGKDLTAGAFTFGLYQGDTTTVDPIQTVQNDKDGKIKLILTGLTIGEYDYTLKEEKAGQTVDGVAYDAKEVKVHVKVEQNQGDNNKTKVTVTYDGAATAPTFNNTHDAKGSVILTATKTIKVADGFDHTTKPADGEFTFDLKDAAGNVLDTAKNDANGKVSFTREFQLSDLDGAASKDFTYTIVEQSGTEPGMVYDTHALTYKVTVKDDGTGTLNAKAIVTSTSGPETFTNNYQPAATGLALGAQKRYVKKDDNTPIVLKGGEFTFDVYEGNLTAEQLAGAKPVRTATNGADGSVNFDAFSYAKPGTHEYTIVERKGDLAYVTYDAAVHHAVVTVADNAGTLQASVAYDGTNVTKPSFTNTYEAQATDSGAIALTKSVDVHDGSYQLKAGDFAFELVGSDGSVIQTQKNDAHGKVAFDKLTFDHAGTFTYTVREVQPTGDAPGVPGVTYTGKTYTLTYVVKDNNDGKLVVENSTVKPSEGTENGVTPNTMTFANSYQPGATSYQISGTKVLENTDSATMRTPADGEFTFALIDVATGQEIDRTTNVGNAFTFKAISYTATGSHAYQVKEVAGQDGTITYSDAVLDVTVSATDDGSGQLTATANKTAADLTFTNTYTPTATTATITGTKALTGRDLAEGEFSFDLKDADGNVVQTVQNGADGTFGFAPLQLDKVGTYVYTVSEQAGATANGVTYDTTVFTATVTVTENAETHALEAQVAYSKGGKAADAVAFSNSYAPAATEVKLGASKVLSGKDLKEGQFSFQLKDADGKVLQTAKNAAGGTVGFEAISYDKPGTYTYSISEVDDGQKNVTYDAAEHQVTVMVTDDGAGHLVATVTYDGDVAPVFKNTYTPPTTPPVNPPTEPPTNPPVSKEEKPGLPNMGDTSLSPMALGGIAGGAVVLIATGVILRRRNR